MSNCRDMFYFGAIFLYPIVLKAISYEAVPRVAWKTLQIFLNLKFRQMSKKIKKFNFHLFIDIFAHLAELSVLKCLPSFPY